MKRAAALVLLLSCAGCDEQLKHVSLAAPVPAAPPAEVAAGARATDHFATSAGDLAVVPLEHATVLLVWNGVAIYLDPTSPAVDDASLPKADLVLVTDPHYDHLDPFALSQVRREGTTVVGPPSLGETAHADVILKENESRRVREVDVTAVPAYGVARGPGPGLLYHERGKASGYLLALGGLRVYVSGDSECTPEVKALPPVDLAFVSVNTPYAMTPAEATDCVAAFRPKVVIPYAFRHAGPRPLDARAIPADVQVRMREFYPRGKQLRARAYEALSRGQWGYSHDLLDEAQRLDPDGESDFRVQWTRQWLREYENPWPW